MNTNYYKKIQKIIADVVVKEIAGHAAEKVKVEIGPLRVNYFSFVFPIAICDGDRHHKVYVKIPKEDMRYGAKTILPITEADRIMAKNEVKSLQLLESQWNSEDLQVSWIRFRMFIQQYNAIVTDAVEAPEALAAFRRMEFFGHFGRKKDQLKLRDIMARLGNALGQFHKKSFKKIFFRFSDGFPKMEYYCGELQAMTKNSFLGNAIQELRDISGFETEAWETQTLKGIDIRNVLMDEKDRVYLLDPGPVKLTCREADLARFIMTYRILYWGSKLFLLGIVPDVQAEEAFLEAYYSVTAPPDLKLLSLYLIKEQLKHWHTAIDSLCLLKWAIPVKKMVAAVYINPFYTSQLKKEIKKVV